MILTAIPEFSIKEAVLQVLLDAADRIIRVEKDTEETIAKFWKTLSDMRYTLENYFIETEARKEQREVN